MKEGLRIAAQIIAAIVTAWLMMLGVIVACRGLLAAVDSLWPDDPPQSSVLVTRADFPICVTEPPGPLIRRKGINLYPRRDETA